MTRRAIPCASAAAEWVGKTFTFHYAVIDDQGRRDFATATVVIDPPPETCEQLDPSMSALPMGPVFTRVLSLKGSLKYCWDKADSKLTVTKPFEEHVNDVLGVLLDLFTLGVDIEIPEGMPSIGLEDQQDAEFASLLNVSGEFDQCWKPVAALLQLVDIAPFLNSVKYGLKLLEHIPIGAQRVIEWILKHAGEAVERLSLWLASKLGEMRKRPGKR